MTLINQVVNGVANDVAHFPDKRKASLASHAQGKLGFIYDSRMYDVCPEPGPSSLTDAKRHPWIRMIQDILEYVFLDNASASEHIKCLRDIWRLTNVQDHRLSTPVHFEEKPEISCMKCSCLLLFDVSVQCGKYYIELAVPGFEGRNSNTDTR
jgi:hypothetical protein